MTARTTVTTLVLTGLLEAAPASGQTGAARIASVRAMELSGHVGLFRAGSDEGTIGKGPTYGGTLVVPVRRGFALDLDVQTGLAERHHRFVEGSVTYRTRRTLVIPSLIYRFGTTRLSGFVGGGVGAQFERSQSRQRGVTPTGQPWLEIEPGVFELDQSDVSRMLSMRTGFAAFVTEKIGLRGDVLVAGWHVGARVSVGYRFG
jgi:hypothetical protein